jgi:polyvinyl alcohol dehydrogenase (cytochrome)
VEHRKQGDRTVGFHPPRRAASRAALLLLLLAFLACSSSQSNTSASHPSDAGVVDAVAAWSPPPIPTLDCSDTGSDWPMYGHNVCNTFASRGETAITTASARKLGVKWTFEATGDVTATPAVVAGQVYVPDWGGMLNRIDASTGKTVWSKSVADLAGLGSAAGEWDGGAPDQIISRGTPVVTGGMVIFGLRRTTFNYPGSLAYMVAVDQDTGALRWKTLLDPHWVAIITASPVLEAGRIYVGVSSMEEDLSITPGYTCCIFRGSVAALDVKTGGIVWQTPMIDDSVYFQSSDGGPDGGTTLSGMSGAPVWSGAPAVDRKRRSLYVTTGDNYSAPPGVHIPIDGDRAESIVSLDLDTGAVKWATKMTCVPDDIFAFANPLGPDLDFGGGANLFPAKVNGVTEDLVGAGQKSGVYWAVDADTGAIVWQRQVGPRGRFGGIHWGTAVDGWNVYAGVNDETGTAYPLGGKGPSAGKQAKVGSWAALDPATGDIRWQVANPAMTAPLAGASVNAPVVTVNGVLFAGSMDAKGTMYALDTKSGAVLWSFKSGGTVYGSPAVSNGTVYWGCGFPPSRCIQSVSGCHGLGFGTSCKKLYAFDVKP